MKLSHAHTSFHLSCMFLYVVAMLLGRFVWNLICASSSCLSELVLCVCVFYACEIIEITIST